MKTLLLVEDNDVEREGLAAVLRQSGYNVVAAPTGGEALDLAEQQTPDLILLDMMMKGTDGWDFLDRRKGSKNVQNVPVFIVTGLAVASDQWAQSLGADGLVKKPVDTEAMLKKIEERTR